jgi:hypothetical protein
MYFKHKIENSNREGTSICAIGIFVVKYNKISEKKYILINPEEKFSKLNKN